MLTVTTPRSLADVRQFVKYVVLVLDVNFHPDHNFSEYVTAAGEATFTAEECTELDNVLADCATVCAQNGTDIYEVSLPILTGIIASAPSDVLANYVRTFGILDTTELLAGAATTVATESDDDDKALLLFAAKALTNTPAAINKA